MPAIQNTQFNIDCVYSVGKFIEIFQSLADQYPEERGIQVLAQANIAWAKKKDPNKFLIVFRRVGEMIFPASVYRNNLDRIAHNLN